MELLTVILIRYFFGISALSVIMTVSDKVLAIRRKRRISEKTLMILGLFGGAAAMYLTMLLIRHKTLHKKFMIGLPIIILFQIFLVAFLKMNIAA